MTTSASAMDYTPSFKFKNDFRLRYQNQKLDSAESRSQYRFRLRLSTDATLSETTSVKVRLATGTEDPRSTNQTSQDSFRKSDFRVDYSFIKHKLSENTYVMGGKMNNPLWKPGDMLWDTDISPDGAALVHKVKQGNNTWFLNTAYFVIDELETEEDPYLFAIQQGVKAGKAKLALTFYHAGNSSDLYESDLKNDITALVLTGALKGKTFSPFMEIMFNMNESHSNKGAMIGAKFGKSSLKKFGDWKSKVNYRYLQQDAWLATLPDSDAYDGNTNAHGLEVAVAYGLSSHTSLGVDMYYIDAIMGESDKEFLLQIDLKTKF